MGSYSENAGLREAAPFLCRLAHDASGNTLALLAAGLFPLLALVGGGVDMGRNYLAQSRLQQACDAGVLSSCPAPASPLAQMTAAQVDEYLSSLTPEGSTYHDIGMIWGARMLSPTGIFADENADHAGKPTNRNLIFLTDGETAPLDLAYGAYGIEPLDGRRWKPGSSQSLVKVVEGRFAVACEEAKKRNIKVWVIGFGINLNPVLTTCAGPGRAFEAADARELQTVFSTIAAQLGDLRVTK